jgi:4a-hydroxytetrahydrobiopterin dehydratase
MSETPGRHGLLSPEEVEEQLRGRAGWRVEDGALVKSFTFSNFVSAVAFVDRLTFAAEAQNHHPDLEVGWGKVTARLRSHDAGGITARDFRLAAALDEL